MKAVISAVLVAVGSVAAAAPAHADQAKYLGTLDGKFANLSQEQLLTVGSQVCAALGNGTTSPQVLEMVQKELTQWGSGVTVAAALDVVTAAAVDLCPPWASG
ncbi:MAG: DUF732 domain-containing protein [Mycolicibacterium sp.]|nr:DUF732 domain-containing protein [Mycolicibacterium sp.]